MPRHRGQCSWINGSQHMKKPESGCFHVIQLIRGNCKHDVFSELFILAPELQNEYIVTTIDVKERKLKIFYNQAQVDEFKYQFTLVIFIV